MSDATCYEYPTTHYAVYININSGKLSSPELLILL
jgi:hypothetical protein